MNGTHGLVILISVLFGMLCIRKIRTYDIHEKEPFWKMLLAMVWGGVWSIGISLVLYRGADIVGFEIVRNWTGALLGIGPIEEFGKLAALFSCYFFIRKELNEPVDGMIYMACVALGFSIIENYFYTFSGLSPNYYLLIFRSLICTPVHILFSAFMGLGVYVWIRMGRGWRLLLFAFLYASIIHGLYDGILFSKLGGWGLLVLIFILYRVVVLNTSLLEYTTAISPARCSLVSLVHLSSGEPSDEGLECLHCGSKNPKVGYSVGSVYFQKCDACSCYVTTKRGLGKIFRRFASRLKSRKADYYTAAVTGTQFSTLCRDNYVSDKKELAFFYLEPLNEAIEGLNSATIHAMQERWWFPELQKVDGNCLVLDIEGLLACGDPPVVHTGQVIWSDTGTGETYASAEYTVRINTDSEMELTLHYPHETGIDGSPVIQKVLIKQIENRFGGTTWRFVCPAISEEKACERLVEHLYLTVDTRLAGCNNCNNVTSGIQKQARLPQWRPEPGTDNRGP